MPIWILLAIMPLVIGGPEVKFCHSNLYFTSLYLPVLGRCFSNSPSSLMTMPPVTVLVVVFCVPMPISIVCAWVRGAAAANASRAGRASRRGFSGMARMVRTAGTGRSFSGELQVFELGLYFGP